MPSLDTLTDRIRAELTDLPGLTITFANACRLSHAADDAQCLAALDALVKEGFLRRSPSGAFIALPMPRCKTAKAAIAEPPHATRCPHCHHLNAVDLEHTVAARSGFTTYRCVACWRLVTLAQISA